MESYLDSVIKQFKYYQQLGARTMDQLSDDELLKEPQPGVNSIAIIVKHLHGNMLSRWTDFLTSDGEKPSRNRDGEFQQSLNSRQEISEAYAQGWTCLFKALTPLNADNLDQLVYIRNEGHTVVEAINRQLCHYAYHIGQLVFIGKIFRGDAWDSLSIPKNASAAYNADKFSEDKHRGHFTDTELK